ncbi:MAG: hypothetical protein GQ583_11435 [Methyloprofundus sp.]|nr:hypothetical protein [Methyloprofundus sp.]
MVKHKNGIKIYTRTLANSDYPEFRGEMNIMATIEELFAFINDAEHCPVWRYKCIKMLKLSDGYIYKLSSLPWPFKNRYTVMKSKTRFDKQNNTYTVKLKNIKQSKLPRYIQQQLPELEGTAQMRYSDGYWQFKLSPTQDSIHITYQMHGDAGVALPSELTRLGIINSAFVTLSNLKKHFIQTR